jgi:RNA polymerase primary sigma factor
MKNGPVISNISLINKAFLYLGSPLHNKLIIDYIITNYGLGKGTTEVEAKTIVNYTPIYSKNAAFPAPNFSAT